MNKFDEGWWICFLTFAAEILNDGSYGSEELLIRILEGAAVSDAEIRFVLNSDFTHSESVRIFLRGYKS